MKSLLVGAALGAAAMYVVQRNKQDGGLDKMCNEAKDYADKFKKSAKDTWDKGVNKAEMMNEQAHEKIQKADKKVQDAMK